MKIKQLIENREFKNFINAINTPASAPFESSVSLPHQTNSEQNDAELQVIENKLSTMRKILNDLFYDLFLAKSTRASFTRSSSSKLDFILTPKSNYIYERLEALYSKHLYHYSPYMEIKLKRNVSMAYYGYLLPGFLYT